MEDVIDALRVAREASRSIQDRHAEFGALGFPSRQAVTRIIDVLAAALFPLRLGPPDLTAEREDSFVRTSLESALPLLASQVPHGSALQPSRPGWRRN